MPGCVGGALGNKAVEGLQLGCSRGRSQGATGGTRGHLVTVVASHGHREIPFSLYSYALPAFLPGAACWDQRGVLRSFSWVSGPFLRDQLLAPRDQALVPRGQALFPALGSAPVLPPPPSPLGLLCTGTAFLTRRHQKPKGRRCTACAALPLPQSTLSSEPSSTPRLLWPPSRRAPVVPIRVCQHDDANRRKFRRPR